MNGQKAGAILVDADTYAVVKRSRKLDPVVVLMCVGMVSKQDRLWGGFMWRGQSFRYELVGALEALAN